jgi:hypothetical protein
MLAADQRLACVLFHVGLSKPRSRKDDYITDYALSFYSQLFTLATKLTKYMVSLEIGNLQSG